MLLRLEAPSRRTQVNRGHPLLIAAVLLVLSHAMSIAQPRYQVYGLDFSPYLTGQQPGNQITAAQIQARLTLIAPYTKWVRTYSSLNGLDQVCPIAHSLGLKCAAGASIYGNATDSRRSTTRPTINDVSKGDSRYRNVPSISCGFARTH